MAPEISFDVEAFILEATAFPNAAHDDQIDAASMYLIETYLAGGESSILIPIGRIPLSSVSDRDNKRSRRSNDASMIATSAVKESPTSDAHNSVGTTGVGAGTSVKSQPIPSSRAVIIPS
jgi:hypothetical protein